MVGLLQVIQNEGEGCRSGNRVRRSGRRRSALIGLGPAPLCPAPIHLLLEKELVLPPEGALEGLGRGTWDKDACREKWGAGGGRDLRFLGGSGSGKGP